jgi:hypothetical protein
MIHGEFAVTRRRTSTAGRDGGDVLCLVPVSFRGAVRNSAHAISMICGEARGPTMSGAADVVQRADAMVMLSAVRPDGST